MRNGLFLTALCLSGLLLDGCSTPAPAPLSAPPVLPSLPMRSSMENDMQSRRTAITTAGGLAALGIDESRSLELALNQAKVAGRKELARMLALRVETLAAAFAEETAVPHDSLLLADFTSVAQTITQQTIIGSVAQAIQYETVGERFRAYAIMTLDPQVIADQLARQTDLFAKLEPTQAYAVFLEQTTTYEAFRAAQK